MQLEQFNHENEAAQQPLQTAAINRETFYYDNAIVRNFANATIIWGVVGMLAGLWAATPPCCAP
jgi:cytochrome c oxidase cbb3-type subunit I/II